MSGERFPEEALGLGCRCAVLGQREIDDRVDERGRHIPKGERLGCHAVRSRPWCVTIIGRLSNQ